jgi:hypothetical protein
MAATEPGDPVVIRNVLYVVTNIRPAGGGCQQFTLRLDPDDGSRYRYTGKMLTWNTKVLQVLTATKEGSR